MALRFGDLATLLTSHTVWPAVIAALLGAATRFARHELAIAASRLCCRSSFRDVHSCGRSLGSPTSIFGKVWLWSDHALMSSVSVVLSLWSTVQHRSLSADVPIENCCRCSKVISCRSKTWYLLQLYAYGAEVIAQERIARSIRTGVSYQQPCSRLTNEES